jgi:queuine tRNA-ribosyltransferase
VGEDVARTRGIVALAAPRMDPARPRYLMGMGTPEDILHAVTHGIDMFDCVLPTRNARNGQVFSSRGRYSIKWTCWREDPGPLDPGCPCPVCRTFDRRYLRHLYVSGEMLSARLLTLHNLSYYASLMRGIREAIAAGRLGAFASGVLEGFGEGPGGEPS